MLILSTGAISLHGDVLFSGNSRDPGTHWGPATGKTGSKGAAQLYVYLVSQQTFYSTFRLKALLKISHAIWTPRAMLWRAWEWWGFPRGQRVMRRQSNWRLQPIWDPPLYNRLQVTLLCSRSRVPKWVIHHQRVRKTQEIFSVAVKPIEGVGRLHSKVQKGRSFNVMMHRSSEDSRVFYLFTLLLSSTAEPCSRAKLPLKPYGVFLFLKKIKEEEK